MTAPLNFTSRYANRGLGSSEASVERPNLRNSSNYVLRYCVSPELHENPTISKKKDVASNNLKSQRFKINRSQISAVSAFEVVEFVRPLTGSCSDPSHRASAASQSSMTPKTNRTLPAQQLSIQPGSHSSALHGHMRQKEYRKNHSGNLARELFQEPPCAKSSRAVDNDPTSVDAAFTKAWFNRKTGDYRNSISFKLTQSGDHRRRDGTACSVQTTACNSSKTRPWHQSTEQIPMKYFMNGVRLAENLPVAAASDVSTPAPKGTLRPSLFSLRCHRDGVHKSLQSLQSLLQTPERVRMPMHLALDFIQEKVDVWFAACQGDTKLVAAHIDAGVDVDGLDRRYGRTALQYAAGNNNTPIMRLLVQAGADVNSEGSRDKYSNTPLHFAALYGKTEAANYLLDNDADRMRSNSLGLTPLRLALDHGHAETAALLKKYGATSEQ